MSDKLIAFFDFKVDSYGRLQYAVMLVNPLTLEQISGCSGFLQTSSVKSRKSAPTFSEIIYNRLCHMLDGRTWIGYDILKNDMPMLRKVFAEIGKKPPTPKSTIDILPFLSCGSKLARVASEFGLGNQARGSVEDCPANLNAIKHCGALMSLFEEHDKNSVDGFHHMISHLIDHSDLIANFSELDIGSCSTGDPCWSLDYSRT